jgi:hypothetical protein
VADDVQPDEPANDPATMLIDTARRVVPGWLRRVTLEAARRGGVDAEGVEHRVDVVVKGAAADLLERLEQLLRTDVDEQRTTPLSLLRESVREPTRLLRELGAVPPSSPDADRFPDDVYHLGPATWSDVDPSLHEPGLTWGAWKAMTVLSRRRDDGSR